MILACSTKHVSFSLQDLHILKDWWDHSRMFRSIHSTPRWEKWNQAKVNRFLLKWGLVNLFFSTLYSHQSEVFKAFIPQKSLPMRAFGEKMLSPNQRQFDSMSQWICPNCPGNLLSGVRWFPQMFFVVLQCFPKHQCSFSYLEITVFHLGTMIPGFL